MRPVGNLSDCYVGKTLIENEVNYGEMSSGRVCVLLSGALREIISPPI